MKSDVENWLHKLPEHMPLRAQIESVYGKELDALLEKKQSLMGSKHEAMLWIRIGLIDRAHEIVQSATSGSPAYIHGIVHRLEGDYWNAKYWFRQVNDPKLLNTIKAHVTEQSAGILFDPANLTDLIELWDRNKAPEKQSELVQIASLEWNALWSLLQDEGVR